MPLRKPVEEQDFTLVTHLTASLTAATFSVSATTPAMVGAFQADYSPLTPEEIAASDAELEDLYKHSKSISR